MDTVCHQSKSSTELDESIRSMFKWYQGAKICIVYLGGNSVSGRFGERQMVYHEDETLQELLAPGTYQFLFKKLGHHYIR